MLQDLRYAARTLLRNAAFTPAAILSIALGIGAGTAVYSIADTVFLRPLPYPQPGRLPWVGAHYPFAKMEFLGSPDYVAWRRDNHVFENLAATQFAGGQIMLLNAPYPAELHDIRVSANFLRTLGIHPALGRDFTESEENPSGPKVVLLTNRVWQQQFHKDPNIVGRSISLDGSPYTIAGVLPASFEFPVDLKLDILTTLPISPTLSYRDRSVAIWTVYGRLKPSVTISQARADIEHLFAQSRRGMPGMFKGATLNLEPLQQHRIGDANKLLSLLVGAVTCLLLITCANISNLLLAKWSARSGELAIRAAIGAGRARLARQLFTEAGLLTALGTAFGMALAFGLLRSFVHYAGNELPRMSEVTLDARVFGIAFLVAFITTLLFGGLPALQAARLDIQTALQESGRIGLARSYHFAKRALVAAEVALCLILLCGSALLLESLWHLRNDRLGFEPERILALTIPLKGTKLAGSDRAALVNEIMEFARHIPGTEAVSQSECTPLTPGPITRTISRSDRPMPEPFHRGDNIHVCGTDPDYAAAAGLHILRGRWFSEADSQHPNSVAAINEVAARMYFPGEDTIGKQFIRAENGWRTIIGVVSDSKNLGLDAPPAPEAFLNGPVYAESTELQFVIRHIGDPHMLESALAAKLRSMDSGLIAKFEPLTETISQMSSGATFNAVLVGSFALIAFLAAVIGVYGVLASAVTQRTHEIGIRIALGGESHRIFRLVLREGFAPVFVGSPLASWRH